MKTNNFYRLRNILLIANGTVLLLFLLPWLPVNASLAPVVNHVASSSSYLIVADVVSSGSATSSSANFGIRSDLGKLDTGTSTSASLNLNAGFLNMANVYLAISTPSNVSMSPAINTSGGGVGNGSTAWTVTTDSSGGYSLSVKAGTAPALKSATDSFGNYQTQVASTPDYNFREGAAVDFFGFTPEGSDILSLYKDNGVSLCNTGSSDTADKCWDSITTTNKIFAIGAASNHPSGTATTVKFRASAGNLINKAAGSYTATIVVTALAL